MPTPYPRLIGLVALIAGLALAGVNVASSAMAGLTYPAADLFAIVLIPTGLFTIVTGRTQNMPDNPMWWKFAFFVVIGGSIAFGMAYVFAMVM